MLQSTVIVPFAAEPGVSNPIIVRRRDVGRHDCYARVRSRILQHLVRFGRAHVFLCHVFTDHEVSPLPPATIRRIVYVFVVTTTATTTVITITVIAVAVVSVVFPNNAIRVPLELDFV